MGGGATVHQSVGHLEDGSGEGVVQNGGAEMFGPDFPRYIHRKPLVSAGGLFGTKTFTLNLHPFLR